MRGFEPEAALCVWEGLVGDPKDERTSALTRLQVARTERDYHSLTEGNDKSKPSGGDEAEGHSPKRKIIRVDVRSPSRRSPSSSVTTSAVMRPSNIGNLRKYWQKKTKK